MLIATPYRDFDVRDRIPPKIISEVRKTYLNSALTNLRPRLSADMLVQYSPDKNWYPRRVQVRSGYLLVVTPGQTGTLTSRMPLKHLSLQAGPLPHSLAICRGQNVVLTLQAPNEKSFDLWVKIIAIELIRQTPLDAIKYLDIFTLAECWRRREHVNQIKNSADLLKESSRVSNANYGDKIASKKFSYTVPQSNPNQKHARQNSDNPEEIVETLLKKCQNVETYVPVKDKLFLFEALCKMGRKVRSSEDVSLKPEKSTTKRAKSCHDLTHLNTHVAVREICKYFEERGNISRKSPQRAPN